MVNCLRLRLLMVSVSIKPANGQSNRRRGHTVAHRPWRSCEFEHTGGTQIGLFVGASHGAAIRSGRRLARRRCSGRWRRAGAGGGADDVDGRGRIARCSRAPLLIKLRSRLRERPADRRTGVPSSGLQTPSGCREAPCSVAPAVAPAPVPAHAGTHIPEPWLWGPAFAGNDKRQEYHHFIGHSW